MTSFKMSFIYCIISFLAFYFSVTTTPIPLLILSVYFEVIRNHFRTQQGNTFSLSERICSFRKRIWINKTPSEALSRVTIIILTIMVNDGVWMCILWVYQCRFTPVFFNVNNPSSEKDFVNGVSSSVAGNILYFVLAQGVWMISFHWNV